MPVEVERIKEGILENPDFQAFPGKTREESAWATAWSRVKQLAKNSRVLGGAFVTKGEEESTFSQWVEKAKQKLQLAEQCAIGFHQHAGYPYCHPIDTHHRHGGAEYTVPDPEDSSYPQDEDFEDAPTGITVSDVARAHGLTSKTLGRALANFYGYEKESGVGEPATKHVVTSSGQLLPIKVNLLTPQQVRVAHEVARKTKIKSESRSRPSRSLGTISTR